MSSFKQWHYYMTDCTISLYIVHNPMSICLTCFNPADWQNDFNMLSYISLEKPTMASQTESKVLATLEPSGLSWMSLMIPPEEFSLFRCHCMSVNREGNSSVQHYHSLFSFGTFLAPFKEWIPYIFHMKYSQRLIITILTVLSLEEALECFITVS